MQNTTSPKIFTFSIDTAGDLKTFSFEAGTSLLMVGANGTGKSRLAVTIEAKLGEKGHRISAHRALTLNTDIPKIREEAARKFLKYGADVESTSIDHRRGHRWGENRKRDRIYTHLLNDFDALLQTLFAEKSNTAWQTHVQVQSDMPAEKHPTLMEQLKGIWEDLIPHRCLIISGDDVKASKRGSQEAYSASDMSDGERAIFYLIGQTLCADKDTVLIFDEPELHIHRSIMSKLWDKLEAARPDCAFVFISHDLEFAASRVGQKFVILNYDTPGTWTFEAVPKDTGFSEEITTLILGSRRPVLFIESDGNSLDAAVYRNRYANWTVVPKGSCEEVIHSVVTMRRNASLTRVTCAGVVDADGRTEQEKTYLQNLGIIVLSVAEVENLFLLPSVARAIGLHEALGQPELAQRIEAMNREAMENVQHGDNLEVAVARYCRRRIDGALKKIDLSDAATASDIDQVYKAETGRLDVVAIAAARREAIRDSLASKDMPALLALYDNKGLLSLVAKHIKSTKLDEFKSWIVRSLTNRKAPGVSDALAAVLPDIIPS